MDQEVVETKTNNDNKKKDCKIGNKIGAETPDIIDITPLAVNIAPKNKNKSKFEDEDIHDYTNDE